MAIHSSIPAWRIPWTEKPGGLKSIGSRRVVYHWATNTFTLIITQPGFNHREDPLEKEMATHSSILAWRIPWRILHEILHEKIPWRVTVHGVSTARYDLAAKQSPPPKQVLGKLAIIDMSSFYFSFDSYLRRNFWISVLKALRCKTNVLGLVAY